MNSYWSEIVKVLGTSTIFIGAVAWLSKEIWKFYFDKNLKRYEHDLNLKTETFKNNLNNIFYEKQNELNFSYFKYSKLHEKQFEKIEKLYSLLIEFHVDFLTLNKEENFTEEKLQNLVDSENSFFEYYTKNELFFSNELCSLITDFSSNIHKIRKDFFLILNDDNFNKKDFEDIYKIMKTLFPQIKEKIIEDFRMILGVK